MAAPIKSVALAVKRILEENKDTLQYKDCYLGLQNLIRSTPTICVTAERAVQTIHGAPSFQHDLVIRLTTFFSQLSANDQSDDSNYMQSMEFGEKLQHLFNQYRYDVNDASGNQLLLLCLPTAVETGIAARENNPTVYRTVSVTLEGYCHEIMPERIAL